MDEVVTLHYNKRETIMMNLKVLSWNIWGGQHLPEILEFIEKERPDVIGLQEVIEDLDGTNNTAKIIAEKFGYEWFFYPTYEVDTARLYHLLKPRMVRMGNAILSKLPIAKTDVHQLSEEKGRFAVEAVIPANGKELHFYSTHLKHTHQESSELQDQQAQNLAEIMPKENAVLMGDFNATPDGNPVKIVGGVMKSTDAELKPTWSVYPEGCPVCKPQGLDTRLDYIFTSKDLTTGSFTIYDSKGSDHLPISVILKI